MEISRRMSIVIPIIVGILLLAGIVMTLLLKGKQSSKKVVEVSNFHNELFGENVFIFSPDDNPEEVTRVIGDIYNKQEANPFSNGGTGS